MQIFVNEQELDAALSGERTVAEVYEAISRWSADNKRYILNLKVDDREVSMARLRETATESVARLDFYIGDEMDMVLSTLNETDRYVDQIGNTLFEQDTLSADDLSHLMEGVHWIKQIMFSVASILHLNLSETFSPISSEGRSPEASVDAILTRMEGLAEALAAESDRGRIEQFLFELRAFNIFIMALAMQLRTISAGREELLEQVEEFSQKIPDLVQELSDINRDFTTGRDSQAMESLEDITDRLNRWMAALFAIDHQLRRNSEGNLLEIEVEGVTFGGRADALTRMLKDLSAALEEPDIVAVGDILEYELADQLKILRSYLPLVRDRALAVR